MSASPFHQDLKALQSTLNERAGHTAEVHEAEDERRTQVTGCLSRLDDASAPPFASHSLRVSGMRPSMPMPLAGHSSLPSLPSPAPPPLKSGSCSAPAPSM